MQKPFDLFIYEKILKFPNIRANYQKQFSINFHLECKQKPNTTFFVKPIVVSMSYRTSNIYISRPPVTDTI
jgi:hypothetical protein